MYGWFLRVVGAAFLLALGVVMLGAYVRLSDAGLGCPDWPGCYGHLGVPDAEHEVANAARAFPDRPVEAAKAWKEMIHRYFAGALGLLIAILLALALANRRDPRQPVVLPAVLAALVVFQALLGMWTVTLQLKPVIVLAHLLGGFATLSLLWWLYLAGADWPRRAPGARYGFGLSAVGALGLLIVQIALGGWTSANYAALACPDFPTCQGQWWPPTDFGEAFVLWRGLGVNYEFGVLESPARTAIHLTHRLGALVVFSALAVLAVVILRSGLAAGVRRTALVVLVVLCAQVLLGILNVVLHLPLPVAVLHNGTAAVLLLSMLTLIFRLRARNNLP